MTCIIPVFNGERYVREAIETVLAQRHAPLDIIVVDDGSTDRTAEAVRAVDARVRYVRQTNAGPAAARNLGIELARGEYVAFLDCDDRWYSEKLTRQLAMFLERPEVDCCFTYARLFRDGQGEDTEPAEAGGERIETGGCAGSSLLARRHVFERVGSFAADLPHAAAVEWFERARACGVVTATLREVLVDRRVHEDSFSRSQTERSHEEFLQLVKRSLDRRRGLHSSR